MVALTAYCQTLALYFLEEAPVEINDDLYLAYAHNRFQASRYGFKGKISVQDEMSPVAIHQDILKTLKKLSHLLTGCEKSLSTSAHNGVNAQKKPQDNAIEFHLIGDQ